MVHLPLHHLVVFFAVKRRKPCPITLVSWEKASIMIACGPIRVSP